MQAERIRGRADSSATAIYARAYNRTAASRELYGFLKSLEVLEKSMDGQSSDPFHGKRAVQVPEEDELSGLGALWVHCVRH